MNFEYRKVTPEELDRLWEWNIADSPDDPRWVEWAVRAKENYRLGRTAVFGVICDGEPVGEGTLIFSPECRAIEGRLYLADGETVTNINALRIRKQYEGQGHISKLVKLMESYAAEHGYKAVTIGVEPKESRNLGIYLHWGYDKLVHYCEEDEGELVLYYRKELT